MAAPARTIGMHKRTHPKPKILIAGLGNLLLRDDGVGVHVVRELQKDPLPHALVADVGCAVFPTLHLLEWADKVLLIDAMQAGERPGTVYRADVDALEEFSRQASMHEFSLINGLRFLHRSPLPEITVIGVEPEVIDYGVDLSPTVQAAVPRIVRMVKETIAAWRIPGSRQAPRPPDQAASCNP